jgi:hypothetical protein
MFSFIFKKLFLSLLAIVFAFNLAAAEIKYKLVTDGGFDMYGQDPQSTYTISNVQIQESFQYLFNFIVGLSIGIAVVLLAFGGLGKVMEAFGVKDPSVGGKSGIKASLLNPVVGLIIVLSLVIVLRTINPDLLIFPVFTDNPMLLTSPSGGAASSATIDSVGPIPTSDGAPLYAPGA